MFNPVLDVLMEHVKSVSLMDPNIFIVLDLLIYFSQKPKLAKVGIFYIQFKKLCQYILSQIIIVCN